MGKITVTVQSAAHTSVTLLFHGSDDSDLIQLPLAEPHGHAIAAILAADPFPRKPGALSHRIIEVSETPGQPRKATILSSKGHSRTKTAVEVPESMYLLIWNCWRQGKLPYALSSEALRR